MKEHKVVKFWNKHKETIASCVFTLTMVAISYRIGFSDGANYELCRLAKLNNPLNF